MFTKKKLTEKDRTQFLDTDEYQKYCENYKEIDRLYRVWAPQVRELESAGKWSQVPLETQKQYEALTRQWQDMGATMSHIRNENAESANLIESIQQIMSIGGYLAPDVNSVVNPPPKPKK